METNYTVDFFIRKFEGIPEDKIITGQQYDEYGNHCVYGWCAKEGGKYGDQTEEGIALRRLVNLLPQLKYTHGMEFGTGNNPAQINNGNYKEYQQPTPKQRILAALYDIKKMQHPEMKQPPRTDITASLAVLPIAETLDVREELVKK